jgi:hypothetical protein
MFLLASWDFFLRRIVDEAPRFGDKKRAMAIARDLEHQISRYLAAITVINAGLGLAIGLALWAVGMPNPHLWGIAAFVLNYLPFLGAIAGTLGVAMVALVTFDTVGRRSRAACLLHAHLARGAGGDAAHAGPAAGAQHGRGLRHRDALGVALGDRGGVPRRAGPRHRQGRLRLPAAFAGLRAVPRRAPRA